MGANQPAAGGDRPADPLGALASSRGGSHTGAAVALALASVLCSVVGAVSFLGIASPQYWHIGVAVRSW
jgi:hypothetical protein